MARIKPHALLLQSKKKKGPNGISITTIVTCSLAVVLIMLSFVAAYKHWSKRSSEQEIGLKHFQNGGDGDLSKYYSHPYAVLNTSKGLITVELNKESFPGVVERFLHLCSKGYFNGMLFHRVMQNFIIEGGDPQGLGEVEDWITKGRPQSQHVISPRYEAFMIGTSRTKLHNSPFNLFITTVPISDLNDKLILFGRVIKGQHVVQEIEEVDTDDHFLPKAPVGIYKVALKSDVSSS